MSETSKNRHQKLTLLCALQHQLYAGMLAFCENKGLKKISETASALGVTWGQVNRFLTKKQPLYKGGLLAPLTKAMGQASLAQEVEEAATGLSDRLIGITLLDPSTVELACGLFDAFEQSRTSAKGFSKNFGHHKSNVAKLVGMQNKLACELLGQTGTREEVLETLSSGSWRTQKEPEEVPSPSTFRPGQSNTRGAIGAILSTLHNLVTLLRCMEPEQIRDADRRQVVGAVKRLLDAGGITEEVLKRLDRPETQHPGIDKKMAGVLKALAGRKR